MKIFNKLLLVTAALLTSVVLLAQESYISGTVIDDATGETLIGVAVVIDGTTTGASTDLDGQFQIKAQPGTYNITASFISFSRINITDVIVEAGKTTVLGTLRMKSASEMLNMVVIKAKAVRNTEAALVTMKRKSTAVIDGISSASFKKTGDSDAASAMSRVTGVSVQGGKYVYVRGLGDRYTKTTLNGMEVPGLDPDRNTVQMDIFPTSIIDNIVVSKSFTADLPADFTGGAVNIELKDFPEKKEGSVSVGLGYNPSMHFNSDYITYDGGKTDMLGFDDGGRDIPTDGIDDANIPSSGVLLSSKKGAEAKLYHQILQGFNPQMGGYREQSFMNTSLSASFANQKALGETNSLGYSVGLSYKNDVEYYEGAEFNMFGKPADPSKTELDTLQKRVGDYGVSNVLLGGMAGVAYKTEKSKVKLNLLHLQNGESKAGIFDYSVSANGTQYEALQYNIEYSERSLTNLLLNGKHKLGADNNWELEWKIAPTLSKITDPDVRFMRLWLNDDGSVNDVITTEVGFPERIWRFLDEVNIPVKVDVTQKHKILNDDAKLKFGASYTTKARDYSIKSFQINPQKTVITDDPNDLFNEGNLASKDNRNGVAFNPLFTPNNPNEYSSRVNHAGVYVSEEFNPTDKLKAIVGVRTEKYAQYYTGQNQTGTIVLDDEEVLNDLDFFPTVNLIYALTKKQNLRGSFSKTIARPSFKEMSYAEITDPISGRTFAGGLFKEQSFADGDTIVYWDGDLKSTDIINLDLRWEMYPKIGQTVAVSGFYKNFKNPIELVQFLSDPGTYQTRNVGDALVLGTEIELIQGLGEVNEALKNFTINANFTYAHSQISMSESEIASRNASKREGEVVETKRRMAGQAPYLVNLGLSYNNKEKQNTVALSYNVQGETLQYVGFGQFTDVYSVPFHSLNFKASTAFGVEKKLSVALKISNILNDKKEEVFRSYMASDQILSRIAPQRTFGLSISYKFF